MLHPSYTELMERINKDVEEGDTPIVQSRYSIVKATADRAKQIIDARAIGDKIEKQIKNEPLSEPVISDSQHLTMRKGFPLIDNTDEMKPLSIAIEELYTGKVKISERAETEAAEATEELSEASANVIDESEDVTAADLAAEAETSDQTEAEDEMPADEETSDDETSDDETSEDDEDDSNESEDEEEN